MRARRIARRRGANPRRPLRGGASIAATYPFTVTSLNPNTIPLGSANTSVDVVGVDFQSGSTAYVDGVAMSTTFVSPTLMRFTFTAAAAATPGYKGVVIKRTTFASNTRFIAVPYPLPTITSASLAGNVLSIGGTNFFSPGTHTYVDTTTEVPFTYTSATAGTCLIPQSVLDVPGTHTIRAVNDAPGGGASGFFNFDTKYKNSVLVSLSATQQYRGRDSGTITLTGDLDPSSLFYPVSIVKVDGTSISFTYLDGNHLSFNIPGSLLMTAGNHAITVSNPTVGGGGGTSNALQFLAFAPTFDAISISRVPQYFDGFDVTGHVDMIDSNFEATFNDVPQPTTLVDTSNFIVSILSSAIAVPGVTTIKLRDKISGATTNAQTMTVVAWDPLRLGSTLRLWLDGSSLVDDGSGKASAWNDKSGGGRHFAQATAGKRPQIIAAQANLNNKPAARFASGSATNMTYVQWLVSTVNSDGFINKDRYTIYVVAYIGTAGTGQNIMGETNGYIYFPTTQTSPNRLVMINDAGGGGTNTFQTNFNWLGTPFVLRARKGSGLLGLRANRQAEDAAAYNTNLGAFTPVLAYIGSGSGGSGYLSGDVAEIIICDTDINATYKAILENRFSYIYGLPFGSSGSAPAITSISPNSCTQYDLPFYIVVENTAGGYSSTSVINVFDTALPTEFLGVTQIRARIPTTALATAGGLAISVADAGGISAPIGLTVFAYTDRPGPNLHTTTPNAAYQHGAAFTLDCTGVGFTPTSVVYANGIACATTPDTATHLTATVPVTALDTLPGPLITIHDGAAVSNPLEITLTPWSPASILGLTGWYKASSVVMGSGSDVAQVNDLSGKGNHYTQATVANRPVLIASDARFNGSPTIDFDGVNDYMTGPTFSAAFTGTNAGAHYGLCFRADTITGTGVITTPYNNNCVFGGAAGWAGFTLRNTPVAYSYGTNGSGSYWAAQAPVAANVTYCVDVRYTSAALNFTINNVLATPGTPGAAVFGGAQLTAVGSNSGFTSNFLDGALAEWWTTNVAATAQDLICWRNYCRYHHGTP